MDSAKSELQNLLEDLRNGTNQERRYAAEDLGYGKFYEAVPDLVKGLSDPTIAVSEACANALIRIGGKDVACQIVPALSTEDVRLRNYVVEILSLIGEISIPILKDQLQNGERDVRIFAVDILTKIRSPQSIETLLQALSDPDINVASTAADGLGDIASDEHITILLNHMNEDAWMRSSILRGISRIGGPKAFEAVSPFTEDNDMLVKFSAIKALGKIGHLEALPRLLEILQYDDVSIYGGETVNAILKILSVAPECGFSSYINEMNISPLLELTRIGSTSEKIAAIQLLGQSGNNSVIGELTRFFSDPMDDLRKEAIKAIITISPIDPEPLVNLLQQPNSTVEEKRSALECIGRSGSQQNFEIIAKFLKSDDRILQKDTLDAIHADFTPIPVEEIVTLLQSECPDVKISAARAMKRLGSSDFIPALVDQLSTANEEIQDTIDAAIMHIGKINASPMIQPYLGSFNKDERVLAFKYFGLDHPEKILEKTFKGLEDSRADIRKISFKVIANLGQATLNRIEKGLNDSEENVRVEAARTVETIEWTSKTLDFVKVHLLKTHCERVKVELIQLIGRLATTDIIDFLVQFLNSPSPWVQLETVEALKTLGDPSVTDQLKKLLNSESIDLVEAVESAISELDYS